MMKPRRIMMGNGSCLNRQTLRCLMILSDYWESKGSRIGVSIQEFIDILNEYLAWFLGNMSLLEYRRSLGLAA